MAREDKHTKHRIWQQITLTHSLFEEDSVLSKTKEEEEEMKMLEHLILEMACFSW